MQETKDRPHLIVGLGNPGDRFRDTRHNIGFACVDLLAKRWGIAVNDRRRTTVLGEGYRNGAPVVLAKPRTFMNLSGEVGGVSDGKVRQPAGGVDNCLRRNGAAVGQTPLAGSGI